MTKPKFSGADKRALCNNGWECCDTLATRIYDGGVVGMLWSDGRWRVIGPDRTVRVTGQETRLAAVWGAFDVNEAAWRQVEYRAWVEDMQARVRAADTAAAAARP